MPSVCSAAVAAGAAATGAFGLTCDTGLAAGVEPESRLQAANAITAAHSSRTLAPLIICPSSSFASHPRIITKYATDHNRPPSQLQRLLEHRCQLILQRAVVLLPIARLRKPGESHGKGRIMPASRQPRGIVNHS